MTKPVGTGERHDRPHVDASSCDWVVIFGAAVKPDGQPSVTLRRRIEGAFVRAKQLTRPIFLATGATGRDGPAEAIVIRDALMALGVGADRIVVEDRSNDTLSSVLNCHAILRRHPSVGRIYVCTSTYHVPRCRALFMILGVRTFAISVSDDRAALGWFKWLYFRCREIGAIPYDIVALATRLLTAGTSGRNRSAGRDLS